VSERHDLTVRLSAIRQLRCSVHRIPPRARDDARSPLWWDETARISELIWVRRKQKYFSQRGLTRFRKNRNDLPVGLICRSPNEKFDLPWRQISKQGEGDLRAPTQKAVIPRACGVSSTPRLLDSIAGVPGILDRPVKPCDDTGECGAIASKQEWVEPFAKPISGVWNMMGIASAFALRATADKSLHPSYRLLLSLSSEPH
jgi:hypothetical protein